MFEKKRIVLFMVMLGISMMLMNCNSPFETMEEPDPGENNRMTVSGNGGRLELNAVETSSELLIKWYVPSSLNVSGVKYTGITKSKLYLVISQKDPHGLVMGPLRFDKEFTGTGSRSFGTDSLPIMYVNTEVIVNVKVVVYASRMY